MIQPALGQLRVSNELKKKGIFISQPGVRSVWLRNNLETFSKLLKTLEARVAQEGLIFTKAQVVALELAREESMTWEKSKPTILATSVHRILTTLVR